MHRIALRCSNGKSLIVPACNCVPLRLTFGQLPLQVGQLIAELDPHWSDRLAEMRFVGQHKGRDRQAQGSPWTAAGRDACGAHEGVMTGNDRLVQQDRSSGLPHE
jgi:hypothetical protein